jgi:antitoxin ParD1/3/4
MPTRNVVLTQHQADLIEELVSSGRYQNASEVLRDGLRMVESRENDDRARLKALREAARRGLSDIEAGRYDAFDTRASLRSRLDGIVEGAIARRSRRK